MLGPFLTIHGQDWKAWAARWDLVPVSASCDDCGLERVSTVPIARGNLRGLASPPCKCGNSSRTPYCVVAARGDLFDEMRADR